MKPERPARGSRLAAALAGGALLLVLGASLAARHLPPWSTRFPPPAEAGGWLADFVRRLGAEETDGAPRLELAARRLVIDPVSTAVALPPGLVPEDVLVRARAEVRFAAGPTRPLMALFTPAGVPRLVRFREPSGRPYRRDGFAAPAGPPPEVRAALRAFLHPGETLSAPSPGTSPYGRPVLTWRVQGSRPAEAVFAYAEGGYAFVFRVPEPSPETLRGFSASLWFGLLVWGLLILLFALVVALLLRRRIALGTGALLAGAAFLAALPAWADPTSSPSFRWVGLFLGLAAGFVWALGESLLRPVEPGMLIGLDALTARRLGPQGGRALLWGLAGGLGLAGLDLAANGVGFASQGFALRGPALVLPSFAELNGLSLGVAQAGSILLPLALSLRFLPRRGALAAALLLSSLYLEPWGPSPWWMAAGLTLVLGAGFLWLAREAGLAALLLGAITYHLALLLSFSALHPVWMAADFTLAAVLLLACLGLGIAGLFRPAQGELRRLRPPAFIRRLEEEKRLEGEVAFLSRAQHGLLPKAPPKIAGWELAVGSADVAAAGSFHDFLPDGESRWWLAAGDVAGQGLACAVVQAMAKAALLALVGRGGGPAAILAATHRILARKSGVTRGTTTLALLRFDVATGEGLFANAGHPAPLWLAADGSPAPIEPGGPPLGEGPESVYEERALAWPPGGTLLLGSLGLWDARDAAGRPFYTERAQKALERLGGSSAHDIAQGLLAAWREHREGEEPRDDASVVVVRRLPEGESGACLPRQD